jgi:hypothetical protein
MDMKQQALIMALTTGLPLKECFQRIDAASTRRIKEEEKTKKEKAKKEKD